MVKILEVTLTEQIKELFTKAHAVRRKLSGCPR
jgi:hypothetical protein